MDRRRTKIKVGNRNISSKNGNKGKLSSGVRRRLVNRRNRRVGQGINRRNRLERALGALRNNNRRNRGIGRKRIGGFYRRFGLRKLFVGGLPRSVNNRVLYNLFKREGRLIGCRIAYDRMGYSKGWGDLEYANPRDAWKVIRKWNNTEQRGKRLRVEYKRRRPRRRNFGGFGRGYSNFNNKGFYRSNQNRGRFRGGFGNRRGYY